MSTRILNLDQLEFSRELKHGESFEARLAPIAPRVGAKKLGYNVTAIPAGKRAFPFHNHHANEEMFFVLSGTGTLRYGAEEHPVRAGDVICCPPGGKDTAHQIINTGSEEMRYLAVSTMIDTDVFQYPDSGKFGAVGGREPGAWPPVASFAAQFHDEAAAVDYWKGE